jgi:hypothetical protein
MHNQNTASAEQYKKLSQKGDKNFKCDISSVQGNKNLFSERTVLANARRKLYNSSGGAQKKTFWRLTSDHKQAFNELF